MKRKLSLIIVALFFISASTAVHAAKPKPSPDKSVSKATKNYTAFLRKNDKSYKESFPTYNWECQLNMGEGKEPLDSTCVFITGGTKTSGAWTSVVFIYAAEKKSLRKHEVLADGCVTYLLHKEKSGWVGVDWSFGSDGPFLTKAEIKKLGISKKTMDSIGWYAEPE